MIISMTEFTLNALKGWPAPHAVDFHTEFDPSVFELVERTLPGMVVSLNEVGNYVLGVGDTAVMPMFMFNGSHDPDVENYGGDPATQKGVWIAINPTGQAMALVAVGAYELVSTAFDPTQAFPPNTPLTSPMDGENAGLLEPGTLYTDMIVGITSRGVVDNGYGYDGVAFWPFPVFPNA